MQTNLTSIMNGTAKQVGTATGVNSGNLKKLTIPSQQLTYTKTINPAFYGSTNFRLTIPKQYKPPTVTSGIIIQAPVRLILLQQKECVLWTVR